MSTDLKHRSLPDSPAEPPAPTKEKLDLSVAQVVGGALAAMTAAFLGSRLSLAGTIVGAALASVVAAVAGSLYTASLRTTQDKVRTVWQGRLGDGGAATQVEQQRSAPALRTEPRQRTGSPLSVRNVALGALAAFVLAASVLTGLELVTGQSLSGDNGTTITQVTEERRTTPERDPAPAPSEDPSSAAKDEGTPSPSPSAPSSAPTAAPTPLPEPSPSETPSGSPSSPAEPSPTPSTSTSTTASASAGADSP